jgi:indole-3-glycerol phosphate synthase
MLLDQIIEFKRTEVRSLAETRGLRMERLARARPPRDFVAALRRPPVSAIAEIKPRSPSRGIFNQAADPMALALNYQSHGASAVSVLADREYFGGGSELVELVANASPISLPVLYKEFVVDQQQIYEARACGADAVLLIARAVDGGQLRDFVVLARELGMEALVETFDEDDVDAAMEAGARVVGVNNRDLRTFEVDLGRSARLSRLIPDGLTRVSESGIASWADVIRVKELGFHAILVGEALLTAADPGLKLASLLGRAECEI